MFFNPFTLSLQMIAAVLIKCLLTSHSSAKGFVLIAITETNITHALTADSTRSFSKSFPFPF
jgi:hypothetical protein